MKYKCASFFAGVGGIDKGFEINGFETVYANEIDAKAVHTYENNFNLRVDNRDIHEVVIDLENGIDPIGDIDVILAGLAFINSMLSSTKTAILSLLV